MEFTLEILSQDEVNLILLGLSKLPYERVAFLIPKIQEQGEKQLLDIENKLTENHK